MNVFMLGWEYPPHISGGLGTACEGLTRGLANLGVNVQFIVPHLIGGEKATHMEILDPELLELLEPERSEENQSVTARRINKIVMKRIAAQLSPYWDEEGYQHFSSVSSILDGNVDARQVDEIGRPASDNSATHLYRDNIFKEVAEYAHKVASNVTDTNFDLIHMHDWMTFPAGVAVARMTGRPLVAHIHSLEFDRSGNGGNPKIRDIEAFGLRMADKVIAVSHYTKNLIMKEYGIPEEKIEIVHNGIYPSKAREESKAKNDISSNMVLFLGRITFQKGPDYFVEAAAKVLQSLPDVTFVMAGSGDMLPRMKDRVAELGIENNFRFPGFLTGPDVEDVFSAADLYVMPSVSEPFGIAPLEAVRFETPVIISRQSGVSEVLSHALKSDFWDVDRLADLMINGILYPELRNDLVNMANQEVQRLRWESSAQKVMDLYRRVATTISTKYRRLVGKKNKSRIVHEEMPADNQL